MKGGIALGFADLFYSSIGLLLWLVYLFYNLELSCARVLKEALAWRKASASI